MSIPANIKASGLSIYDLLVGDYESLYLSSADLEEILALSLVGLSLSGLPLRTRSKVVKQHICDALGYPTPKAFQKPNQDFQARILTPISKSLETCRSGMKRYPQAEGM